VAPLDEHRLEQEEVLSLVCHYFCQGRSPSEIARVMWERHRIRISREMPYKFLSQAATRNWLRFVAPREDVLSDRLRRHFPWLRADVLHAASVESVADRAAEVIVDMLCERHRRLGKDTLAVGWSGGHSMGLVAKKLAVLLSEPREGLPKKVVFHSVAVGFDVGSVLTDPGGFLAWIVDNPTVRVETAFVGLRAPAIVKIRQRREMLLLPGIREAAERVKELDIVVTGAGVLDDPHSMLHRYYANYSPETAQFLRDNDCEGDILWLPLRETEPIRLDKVKAHDQDRLYCAMTLLDPDGLHDLIGGGTDVLLVLGPCTYCFRDKSRVLRAILRQSRRLITRLVADSRSVRHLLEEEEQAGRP
jgi:DNA-binding transcriptional regulator LsrR (DeoR family)